MPLTTTIMLIFGTLTLLYVLMLFLEVTKGNRVASDFRLYLDEKVLDIIRRLNKRIYLVYNSFEFGKDVFKTDIIDPVKQPFLDTKIKYTSLKNGEFQLKERPVSKASTHIKKLLKEVK